MYYGKCYWDFCNETMITLRKVAHWTVEVTRSHIHDDFKGSFTTWHGELVNTKFGRNSRKSNVSFFLPTIFNYMSWLPFSAEGKFWLDKTVKMKNMETSEIYSCIFLNHLVIVHSLHGCFLTNDSTWKIELTSQSKLARHLLIISASVGVTGSEKNTSQTVVFGKLAYRPTVSSFINIPNKSISEVKIVFNSTGKTFHLTKIIMTKILTGEEYGCVNIHRTNAEKYTCKVLKGKISFDNEIKHVFPLVVTAIVSIKCRINNILN
ncbi:uncharacterized protein LOC106874665 [Octopus bimaculoides]|uniref:Uncharacterized protein n=1 Tax=Octopus bimaculoides TaxID=37653 RepID=A0A0L8GUH4_OCTBM|nr:uncharacterized protein LOC106874665 [Octopus bimaculoides]